MDRKRIVDRHHPELDRPDPRSPLSVGNGDFAFTADITGLQTFPERYEVPLGTMSNWGWHFTGGRGRYRLADAELQPYETNGREVGYPMKPGAKPEAYHWLRQNPHRLHLGRIAFRLLGEDGEELRFEDTGGCFQRLDLWSGILSSRFEVRGVPVEVETACAPGLDAVGVKVRSGLVREGRLQVYVRFPAPDMTDRAWSKSTFPEWDRDDRHRTALTEDGDGYAVLERRMDEDGYLVRWDWSGGRLERTGTHEYTLHPDAGADELAFTVGFSPLEPPCEPPSASPASEAVEAMKEASARHWAAFWNGGAAIDFAGSSDPRAFELERRVVLSQFLCALHSAGPLPPQETGLMYNSWFGKAHLEMHWWHAAHFPLWGRAGLLARSMDWYVDIQPIARELARSQGYEGARWPKMVGYDGVPCPSPVAPGLIWQQPHPIALAELLYKAEPTRATLEKFRGLAYESADFMASFAVWNEEKRAYELGPPLIPAQECHAMRDSLNPPYELEYWHWGLTAAIRWAGRLGEAPNPRWAEVAGALARPAHRDGVYLAHERCPDTFSEKNHDHPSMLGTLGILPGKLAEPAIMRRTLLEVRDRWQWETAWGWDFPMAAMTAARLGERELAVDFLLMDEAKNTYLVSGHNYQRPGLSAYLPGNGGLLTAVAMMACGWEGAANGDNPGFPREGWKVRWEGLKPWL